MSANFSLKTILKNSIYKKNTYVKLEPRKENVCVNLYEKMPNFYKKKRFVPKKKIIVKYFFSLTS